MNVSEAISKCLSLTREQPSSRELSLTVTKLEEAMMWFNAHERALKELVRKSGVGATMVPMNPPPENPITSGTDGSPT